MPRTVGAVVSSKLATLHELQTVYGVADLYDFLEILAVDASNERRLRRPANGRHNRN